MKEKIHRLPKRTVSMLLMFCLMFAMLSVSAFAAAGSSLRISPTAYPTGTLKQGSYYSLKGTVTSNYRITSVKGDIINSAGKTVCTYTQKVNTTRFSFLNSTLDMRMTFNKLSPGSYRLRYTAVDASRKTVTWTSKNFAIKAPSSTLRISPTAYPSGTLKPGSYYSLKGTVSSNYKITSVKGEILNASGKAVCSYTQYPNSTQFSFFNSTLDARMTFNKLSPGKYTLRYTASDASRKSVSWRSGTFTIGGPSSGVYNLCWPLPSSCKRITSSLGNRSVPVDGATAVHKGIDIAANKGTKVMAAADGVVKFVGYTNARGYYVVIYHQSLGLTSVYQHLSSYSVRAGQSVKKGTAIAKVGSTGISSGPHLHFELVLTPSAPTSVECAYARNVKLLDGHYNNKLIRYIYNK